MRLSFTLALFLLAALFVQTASYAQDAQKAGDAPKTGGSTYVLRMKYPIGIHNIYKLTETTTVKRQYSDSTTKEYKREISYFMLVKQLGKADEGFLSLDVTVDSIQYKFTEGDAVFEFNSQADDPGIVSFDDQKIFSVPLGKNFSMTYSPYGEVAKVEGEDLDWLKNYISDPKAKGVDTVTKFIFLDGISKERLSYLADMKKINFPPEEIVRDSVWKSPIAFQADGVNFFDTATVKISNVRGVYVDIEAKFNNVMPMNHGGLYYGVKNEILNVEQAKGSGTFSLELSPKGTVRHSRLVTTVESIVPVKNDKFKQTVTTQSDWDLVIQYQY